MACKVLDRRSAIDDNAADTGWIIVHQPLNMGSIVHGYVIAHLGLNSNTLAVAFQNEVHFVQLTCSAGAYEVHTHIPEIAQCLQRHKDHVFEERPAQCVVECFGGLEPKERTDKPCVTRVR